MIPPKIPHLLETKNYQSWEEAALAYNIELTIEKELQGLSPEPDELYQLEPYELPTEEKQKEIYILVRAKICN